MCESHPHDGGGAAMLARPDSKLAFAIAIVGGRSSNSFFAPPLTFVSSAVPFPSCFAPVAQLDRASDYGSEGSEFESRRVHALTPMSYAVTMT